MLKAHFAALESALIQTSLIPANAGHSLHKGTPREAFLKQYLETHLSERVALGSGEIIDAASLPNEKRNQMDIVIYKREYPKLHFGGGINAFLAESVVAIIEVKSVLTKEELRKATLAAANVKRLKRNVVTAFSAGHQPPAILNFVVAYDGPAAMTTVHGWLSDISLETGITYDPLPLDVNNRVQCKSTALDGVFVLGRGFMHYGNAPAGFFHPEMLSRRSDLKWVFGESPSGTLLLLFLMLTMASSGSSASWLDAQPYLKNISVPELRYGA